MNAGNTRSFALCTASIAAGPTFPAILRDDRILALRAFEQPCAALGTPLRQSDSVLGLLQDWDYHFAALDRALHAMDNASADPGWVAVTQLRLHAPLQPRQIFCSGANYRKHVVDLIIDDPSFETEGMSDAQRRAHAEGVMDRRAASGKPFVFTKIASSLSGPFDTIVIPAEARKPDWELELGVVIGTAARRVSCVDALAHVAGYVVVNDLTERSLVFRPDVPQMGMDWLASKNAPGYLPVGPQLVPAAFVADPQALRLVLTLNGRVMQDESTADMIFTVAQLIAFISAHVQLLPGDLICTGSPAGNGTHHGRFLQSGDVMEGCITGLGTQRNPIAREAATASRLARAA